MFCDCGNKYSDISANNHHLAKCFNKFCEILRGNNLIISQTIYS